MPVSERRQPTKWQSAKTTFLTSTSRIRIGVGPYFSLPAYRDIPRRRNTKADELDLTPRGAMPEHIEKFLDLSASEEDHGEVSWRDLWFLEGSS